MADVGTPPPGRLARSSSGVWWKLGDVADASEVERRLRGIAEEEAAVRARVERRRAAAPAVRRTVAVTSVGLEVVALLYGLWAARRSRRGGSGWRHNHNRLMLKLLPPALAIPALAAVLLAASARLHKMLDGRDQRKLQLLGAERKANLGNFRGSHHNLQKLIEKYDPDASAPIAGSSKKLKRTLSRLSFHVGDE